MVSSTSTWNLRRFNPENIKPSSSSSSSSGVTKSMNFEIRLVKSTVSEMITPVVEVEGITGRIILKLKSMFTSVSVIQRLLQCSSDSPEKDSALLLAVPVRPRQTST